MKTTEALLIGAVGLGAYYLFSYRNSFFVVARDTQPVSAGVPANNTAFEVNATTKNGIPVRKTISSVQEGVDFINDTLATGGTLQRRSRTLAKVGYNSNIAKLADGSIKQVTVKPVTDGGISSRITTNTTRVHY